MTEANYKHMKARRDWVGMAKLAIAAALGVGIGFYVAQTISHERVTPPESAAAVGLQDPASLGDPREWVNTRSPTAGGGTGSPAAGDGSGYVPNQVVNQARKIESLPPTF